MSIQHHHTEALLLDGYATFMVIIFMIMSFFCNAPSSEICFSWQDHGSDDHIARKLGYNIPCRHRIESTDQSRGYRTFL